MRALLRGVHCAVFGLQICLLTLIFVPAAAAQDAAAREVFQEDTKNYQKGLQRQVEAAIKSDQSHSDDLDFQAKEVEFDQKNNEMVGKGGVLVSRDGMQMQAESARANLQTKEVKLDGDVLMTWPEGEISSSTANVNAERETGQFKDAEIVMEEGNYRIISEEMDKDTEFDYRFFGTKFTTCHCEDGSVPWSVNCSKADMQEEGYAHTSNTALNLFGVPIFYSPYFVVPVKRERSSGLLVPTFGWSSRNGAKYSQPLYLVLDDYSDLTITPFIESKSRVGSSAWYRRRFSETSEVETRWYYSDESERDGDLRGTNTSNLNDPTFDENRYGGFLTQSWQSETDAALPTSINTDVHYVSDDLFLREIDDHQIGERQSRYLTSQALMQTSIGSSVIGEVSSEYNQAMETDDDDVFQRIPEFNLSGRRSMRPFGYNPYGVKVVAGGNVMATKFERKENYDGWRYDFSPGFSVPHHFKNYLNGEFDATMHDTHYTMDDTAVPDQPEETQEDGSRRAFELGYTLSSAVERVYDLEPDSWLRYFSSLGSRSQATKLQRVKHVVEPLVRYSYIPSTYQDDLPLYDSFDRYRQRSLISYGARTSLQGKFTSPAGQSGTAITELTPELADLPMLSGSQGLAEDVELGGSRSVLGRHGQGRTGETRELMYFGVLQSFDVVEDRKDPDPERDALSDIGWEYGYQPSTYFGINMDGNYSTEDQDFSSWNLGNTFRDDRDDLLRLRYSYINETESQVDANVEITLTERLRLGLYARYDDKDQELIESQIALRIMSACRCWYFDVGYSDQTNPDDQEVLLRFTFKGLGEIAQDISTDQFQQQDDQS